MNKDLYGKLQEIGEDFEECYGDDGDNLYFHDIDAVDMMKVVSLFIDNITNSIIVEQVIKKVFDSQKPIGIMLDLMYYKAVL